jgi:putative endonuclease
LFRFAHNDAGERGCNNERGVAITDMNNDKKGYVYILFNRRNGTLYTGVTSNLIKRVYEHKQKSVEGFSRKYGIDKLGYYEISDSIISAIEREKQIKSGSRKKKIALIEI